MFDPLTREAQKILALSRWDAERYLSHAIDTEHLLLAMAEEGGAAAQTLQELKMDVRKLRNEVDRLVDPAKLSWKGRSGKTFPLTNQSKRVLGTALKCAQILGHQRITPDHILLGLAHVRGGIAYEALRHLSGSDTVRDAALRSLARTNDSGGSESPAAQLDRMRKALDENLPRR